MTEAMATSNRWTEIGYKRLEENFNDDNMDGLAQTFTDGWNKSHASDGKILSALVGGSLAIVIGNEEAAARGVEQGWATREQVDRALDPDRFIEDLNYCSRVDQNQAGELLQGLFNAVLAVRRGLPDGSSVSISLPKSTTTAPDPVAVHVVGMPARRTDSTITRDEKGNIVGTVQVETDLQPQPQS